MSPPPAREGKGRDKGVCYERMCIHEGVEWIDEVDCVLYSVYSLAGVLGRVYSVNTD